MTNNEGNNKESHEQQEIDEWYDAAVEELTSDYLDKIEASEEAGVAEYEEKLKKLLEKYNKLSEKNINQHKRKIMFENLRRPKSKHI